MPQWPSYASSNSVPASAFTANPMEGSALRRYLPTLRLCRSGCAEQMDSVMK
jgi:hypothetical protein